MTSDLISAVATVRSMTTLEEALRTYPGRCAGCGAHVRTQGHGSECVPVAPMDRAAAWAEFKRILAAVADEHGLVRMEDMRPRTQHIFHKWRSSFYAAAKAEGLIEPVRREGSTDSKGKNTHHDQTLYKLRSAA